MPQGFDSGKELYDYVWLTGILNEKHHIGSVLKSDLPAKRM